MTDAAKPTGGPADGPTNGNPMHDAAQRAAETMRQAGQKAADGSAALSLKVIE